MFASPTFSATDFFTAKQDVMTYTPSANKVGIWAHTDTNTVTYYKTRHNKEEVVVGYFMKKGGGTLYSQISWCGI